MEVWWRHIRQVRQMWQWFIRQFMYFCNGNNTCAAHIVLMEQDLLTLIFLHVSFAVVGPGPTNQLEDNLSTEFLSQPRKQMPWPFQLTILPSLSLVVENQHIFTALIVVLSLGYSSGTMFHLWLQTGTKILLVSLKMGQTFFRHFHSGAFLILHQLSQHPSRDPYSFSNFSPFQLAILHNHFLHFCSNFWGSDTSW